MFFIVETVEQLNNLVPKEKCFVQVIANNHFLHPALASPVLIYYRTEEKGYILPIDHSEALPLPLSSIIEFLLKHKIIYCIDAKYHSYFINGPLCDVNYELLKLQKEPLDYIGDSTLIKKFYFNHIDYKDVNKLIPVVKLYEFWEEVYNSLPPLPAGDKVLDSFQRRMEKVYKEIEEQGLLVNKNCFIDFFTPEHLSYSLDYKTAKVFSYYNLYNLTGRPTNSFNGINFLALNKENSSRKCFIPENDFFVEFDFDGYHVRLIAEEIGYPLPKDIPVHTYFGKQYFNKEILSEEEYQESKKITFQNLYSLSGNVDIPFFRKMKNFAEELYNTYSYGGFITLPTGKMLHKGEVIGENKLFNYYVQNKETWMNTLILEELIPYLRNKKSKVKLIVYDSFLLDFSLDDRKDTLFRIKNILEQKNLIVKVKYGKDYDSLKKTDYL